MAQQGTPLGSGLSVTVGVGSGSGEGGHAPGPVAAHSVVTGASTGGLVRCGQETDQLIRLVTPGSPGDRVKGLWSDDYTGCVDTPWLTCDVTICEGSDCDTGSIPIRILLAFSASFSQARASSCSASTLVRWGGVGRYEGMIHMRHFAAVEYLCLNFKLTLFMSSPACSRDRFVRLQDFK